MSSQKSARRHMGIVSKSALALHALIASMYCLDLGLGRESFNFANLPLVLTSTLLIFALLPSIIRGAAGAAHRLTWSLLALYTCYCMASAAW